MFSSGTSIALLRVVVSPKRFVYILRSCRNPYRYYTGVTSNVRVRLAAHNAGECTHTAEHRRWEVDLVIAFRNESRALEFERYLKSGSGVAFAQRRLRSEPIASMQTNAASTKRGADRFRPPESTTP